MGGDMRYEIGQNAYIKLVLHALNHKTSAVNGLLLGRLSANNNDVVEITESIEEFYRAQGLDIVGYFHANERFDDIELGNVARNIGDHIHRYFPQAALLLLDNKKLEAISKGKDRSPVVQLYTRDSSKSWKQVGSDGSSRLAIKEPSANIVLLDYISSQKWQDIVDFDDHLDDISKDWLNPELFK
ncbi:hypothetical protein RHSIM_Rhsim04G0011100 [Rhododendron simsii]|uniref:MPN domain-containing protein n=1 Tax=Rhododendron simsii TaxID=118357 RepID=A0A834H2S8_RHOSS|nr:hypothetical protein RHSIM_Rhsim04G0011100 [Rhododendron simsii]